MADQYWSHTCSLRDSTRRFAKVKGTRRSDLSGAFTTVPKACRCISSNSETASESAVVWAGLTGQGQEGMMALAEAGGERSA